MSLKSNTKSATDKEGYYFLWTNLIWLQNKIYNKNNTNSKIASIIIFSYSSLLIFWNNRLRN